MYYDYKREIKNILDEESQDKIEPDIYFIPSA